jgi:protoporphyrinogen oxidase
MSLDIAVIGGGISGLASALRIAERGHKVTLYEGAEVLGGLGTTFPYRGGNLERFYHCILPNDDALLAIIKDLGLDDELLWKQTDMGFMHSRSVYPLNTPADVLRFRPLPFIDRIRLGLVGIFARLRGMDPSLDDISAERLIKRIAGERAFETLWRPLLEAKIGDQYPGIPALWLTSRMHREKSTGIEHKGCLVHGYRSLIDGFEGRLRELGAEIHLGTSIAGLGRAGEAMEVRLPGGHTRVHDSVVVALPLVQFQQLTANLGIDPGIGELRLDYQGVVCGVFLLRRPLSRYYWMPIVASGATAQGVIEMSNLVPLERSGGRYVTYLVNYVHRTSDLFARSDEDLLAAYRSDLVELFQVGDDEVEDAFLFRAPFVEPIWPLGYSAKRPPNSVIPGRLYLASTAQIYPNVNSWNSCCQVVDEMLPTWERETAGIVPLAETSDADDAAGAPAA